MGPLLAVLVAGCPFPPHGAGIAAGAPLSTGGVAPGPEGQGGRSEFPGFTPAFGIYLLVGGPAVLFSTYPIQVELVRSPPEQ